MSTGRTVTGPRDDLTGLRQVESLERLEVRGPVRSLAGLERAQSLVELSLASVGDPDLAVLEALPRLAQLRLESLNTERSLAPLERLTGLSILQAHAVSVREARKLGELNLGGLIRLEYLEISSPVIVRAHVNWVPDLPKLRQMYLTNFGITDSDIASICASPSLQALSLTVSDSKQRNRLSSCVAPHVQLDFGDAPEKRVVVEGPQGVTHVLNCDLAGLWNVETSLAAYELLIEMLRKRAPSLLHRCFIDFEGSAVYVQSADAADLDLVEELIAERASAVAHGADT